MGQSELPLSVACGHKAAFYQRPFMTDAVDKVAD
jgi:hypothetical protein